MTFKIESPKTNKPISVPPRTSCHVKREVAAKIVRDRIQEKFFSLNVSEWASAVVLVTRFNGEYHLCVDYRPLNQVTMAPVYPSPRMHQALDTFQGKKYFSTFDLLKECWQIPVYVNTRKYLAFITSDGFYE